MRVVNFLSVALCLVNVDYAEHEKRIEASGLDLHSCIQFLLDLYSQWTQPKVCLLLTGLLAML